jgi:hypothetical protein
LYLLAALKDAVQGLFHGSTFLLGEVEDIEGFLSKLTPQGGRHLFPGLDKALRQQRPAVCS